MDVIRFAIDNPVKVTVGVLLLLLFGVIALIRIPIQLTPNVDQPIISVTTDWIGRSPKEVEREIIEEQEDKLKSVGDLRKMTATAYEGQAQIELEFYVGADMSRAVQEVSDKLREVPQYPQDVDEPVINVSATSGESPIAWMVLTCDDPAFDVESLRDAAEDKIKPFLERVKGISEVRVYGGRDRQVHIRVDPHRMAQWGIGFGQLRRALQQENVNISAGSLAEGRLEVQVRTVGEYDHLQELQDTIVAYADGGPVRVRDIAQVTLALEKPRAMVRSKAHPAIALPAYREANANVMQVMAQLRQRVVQIQEQILPGIAQRAQAEQGLATPPPLRYQQVYDETIYIDDAIALVKDNLWLGGSLAVLVLLVFLHSIRPTVMVALAIPISVIGTFVVMTVTGRSINVISLAGLAFAVGMVVDAAIVVLENIDRHLSTGKAPAQAAYDATREVWGAVLASTLTTIAVFVPVLTIQEEAGQLFRDIALAICAAVTLSLVVSLTVIPSASARWLKQKKERSGEQATKRHALAGLAKIFGRLAQGYAGLIYRVSSKSPLAIMVRLMIVGLLTAGSIGGSLWLMPPTSYLPAGNQNLAFGFILTPPAYSKAQDRSIAYRLETIVRPYWEARSYEDMLSLPPIVHPFTGNPIQKIPPIENYFFVSVLNGMFTGAISQDKENVGPLVDLLTAAIGSIPGAFGGAQQSSLFGRGLSGANAVKVEVTGNDLAQIRQSAGVLFGALGQQFGFNNLRPSPANFNLPSPELRIQIDRVRAADMGIDVAELGLTVQALVDGATVGDYRLDGESIDIVLIRDPAYQVHPDTLEMIPITVTSGPNRQMVVPLATVANVINTHAPQQILRIEEQRAVTIEVSSPVDTPLEQTTQQIQTIVDSLSHGGQISPVVNVSLAGTADKLTQVRQSLLGKWSGWSIESLARIWFSRMCLALIITYLLMAALFESFLYPFVIMFSVPLATVGGFVGLAIMHAFVPSQQLDMLTMLGFVILIGIVVNNAILIVHQALNFMKGSAQDHLGATGNIFTARQAISESVRTRFRPILMTTMTSVCGMLPLVLMPGSGSELYKGLGSVVVGGLIVSTVFTLVVVPLVFSLVLDTRAWGLARLGTPVETLGDRSIEL